MITEKDPNHIFQVPYQVEQEVQSQERSPELLAGHEYVATIGAIRGDGLRLEELRKDPATPTEWDRTEWALAA